MSGEGAFRNYVGRGIDFEEHKVIRIKFYEPKRDRRSSLFQLE
jgi:hypothetical protein